MLKLHVIIASTRPGRAGLPIATWFYDFARAHGKLETRLVDLAEVNLPFLDEPAHPRLRDYQHEHTKRWSAIIAEADAYVFVTPEYNYAAPPALMNALDFLYHEWHYKPAGFVSYGGQSGGMRSVQMTKQLLTSLRIVPLIESVSIPFFAQHRDASGTFTGTEAHQKAATTMLDELARWAEALRVLRI